MADPSALAGDIALAGFLLDGQRLRADVSDAVTDGEIETTIEGASTLTLTVRDSERRLLESGIYRDRVSLRAAGNAWEFVKVSKSGDDFTLTFEDAIVAALRRQRQGAKASRGKMTRAQFVRARVMVVPRITFVSPELRGTKPAPVKVTPTARDATRAPGIAAGARLTVKGGRASASQIRNMEVVLDNATRLGATGKVLEAVVLIPIAENEYKNTQGLGADSISWGLYQAVPGRSNSHRGTMSRAQAQDIAFCVEAFLKPPGFTSRGGAFKLAKQHPSWSPGEIGAAVEGGPPAGVYDQWSREAKAIIAAYGGDTGSTSASAAQDANTPFEFSQGPPGGPKNESAWAMTGRLADEVGRRRFVVRDTFFYISEPDLMRSRARMVLSESAPGVDNIDFNIDTGAKVDTATVTCRSSLWQAPPGTVVVLQGLGAQVDGRWLVATVNRGLFSTDTTIELRRLRALLAEKKEPAGKSTAPRTTGTDSRVPKVLDGSVRQKIAQVANSQVGFHEGPNNQNPYGPDTAWCAYFASWVWQKAGVDWQTEGWVGNNPPSRFKQGMHRSPQVGDAVLYAGHVGIVTKVNADGSFVSVEGNYSNAVTRRTSHSGVVGFKAPPGA